MAEAKKSTATAKPAPAPASSQAEATVAVGKETVETVVKASGDVFKNYEDVVSYNKENVDAFVEANNIMVKGVQDINKVLFSMAQKNVEETVSLTQKVFGCKSVEDMVKLQSDLMKTNYAKSFDEGRKISDMAVKLAEEAAAPITDRVSVAVEKATKPLAA
ncbi:MAG: phasin family protein [Rhodospirillales bacterium]